MTMQNRQMSNDKQKKNLLLTKKTTMFTVYIDMRTLIDKALKHFYMLLGSLLHVLCKMEIYYCPYHYNKREHKFKHCLL